MMTWWANRGRRTSSTPAESATESRPDWPRATISPLVQGLACDEGHEERRDQRSYKPGAELHAMSQPPQVVSGCQ